MLVLQGIIRLRRHHPLLRRYLLKTIFYLFVARLALRVIPFRWLKPYFERPARRPATTYARRKQIWEAFTPEHCVPQKDAITAEERGRLRAGIPWLINEAAGFLPGETACFARAIAAQEFLRRLGMETTLFYGAATLPNGNLTAHAWLQDGAVGIIGHDTAQHYHVLACYPDKKSGLNHAC